ncbi:MAG TPA: GAF domain-containing protein [Candidatus Limnocylindrales bacterium]|nr:GAF domain-containing protein [Candidatus Limnocylindrales bacterium]
MPSADGEPILIECARAAARGDGLEATLRTMLDAISSPFSVGSGAVVVPTRGSGALEIVASTGLDAAAAAGLTEAMRRPVHPVTRTFSEPVATYDVTPMNPGGPALRSHLPLVVRRDGADHVVGVLALAYDSPIEPAKRPTLEAVADLAAIAIDRADRD